LKFGVFVHPDRPKVPQEEITHKIEKAGFAFAENPDVAIVVGGDGTFGYYGRILQIPMLFVGVKESTILGSRARLAEISYNNLEKALADIEQERYSIIKRKMLSVNFLDQSCDVLIDTYLERGAFSGCIRYKVHVKDKDRGNEFCDYGIGNGVIVSTAFGSGGYFSYPDRIEHGRWDGNLANFSDDRIGICHIVPAYLMRKKNAVMSLSHKVAYTIPHSAQIDIELVRNADVRLYGVAVHSTGVPISINDKITISQSAKNAKIIKLKNQNYRK